MSQMKVGVWPRGKNPSAHTPPSNDLSHGQRGLRATLDAATCTHVVVQQWNTDISLVF